MPTLETSFQSEAAVGGGRDTRLIGGSWMVENVREELDARAEFFFNDTTRTLDLAPNSSAAPPLDLVVRTPCRRLPSLRGAERRGSPGWFRRTAPGSLRSR